IRQQDREKLMNRFVQCMTTIGLAATSLASSAAHADMAVYDDALRNGFQDWSWGDVDMAADFHVRSGLLSILFRAHSHQGLSFARPGPAMTVAQFPEMRLWVRGDAGGEQLRIVLQSGGTAVAQGALDAYIIGGAMAAGQYREAIVRFDQPPLSYAGSFDRIDLVDASGNGPDDQQFINIDDVFLVEGGDDLIFADGFNGGGLPPAGGLVIERDVVIDTLGGDRFHWTDSAGQPRSAVL